MAKRPSLSDQSFLGYVFSPKKNPLPSGIRKSRLVGTQGGRTKGRLAAYNRMSPANQELLKRAGTRDAYLKGEGTLADARRTLREKAVQLGIAKPLRPRPPKTGNFIIRTDLDKRVAGYLKQTLIDAGASINPRTIDANVPFIPDQVLPDVLGWDYGQIKYAARQGSEYVTVIDGKTRNLFWYR
jgi:hypothetical protein